MSNAPSAPTSITSSSFILSYAVNYFPSAPIQIACQRRNGGLRWKQERDTTVNAGIDCGEERRRVLGTGREEERGGKKGRGEEGKVRDGESVSKRKWTSWDGLLHCKWSNFSVFCGYDHFRHTYELPGTTWKLSGHSRALERTGFLLCGEGLRIVLDAGVDIPDFVTPDIIVVTHTHIDHCNALPMMARYTAERRLTHIFVPAPVIDRLREFVSLSFSIKVDEGAAVPDHYQSPSTICGNIGQPNFAPHEQNTRRWYPVVADLQIPVSAGKKGHKTIVISTLQLYHTVTTVGYILSERVNKVRTDLVGSDKKTTGENVKAAKLRGEEVTILMDTPLCAFVCDTSLKAVTVEGMHSRAILACPVVMIECTYLEEEFTSEAERRGHIVWSGALGLQHVVMSSIRGVVAADATQEVVSPPVFILMHFSLRYSDDDIRAYFRDRSGLGVASTEGSGKPHVVLWLDSGIEKLWFNEII